MMLLKNKKLFLIIIMSIILIPLAFAFIPIRFSIRSVDLIEAEEYYIVYQIPMGSTDYGWYVIGDQDGIWENAHYVSFERFKGENPEDYLSQHIYAHYNQFIVYGTMTKEPNPKCEGRYIYSLDSTGWDIFGEIDRSNYCGNFDFRHFITVYDLKWID